MVKSVDPDATTAVTKNENDQKDVVKSITHDLHEQSMEENMADNMGEGHPQNQTGKKHKWLFAGSAPLAKHTDALDSV